MSIQAIKKVNFQWYVPLDCASGTSAVATGRCMRSRVSWRGGKKNKWQESTVWSGNGGLVKELHDGRNRSILQERDHHTDAESGALFSRGDTALLIPACFSWRVSARSGRALTQPSQCIMGESKERGQRWPAERELCARGNRGRAEGREKKWDKN